jgi:hypothetical protein
LQVLQQTQRLCYRTNTSKRQQQQQPAQKKRRKNKANSTLKPKK